MITRKPIRKSRSKPRPGRLKGHDMAVLRAQVFERDGYRCQHVPWPRTFPDMRCMRRVTWENGPCPKKEAA